MMKTIHFSKNPYGNRQSGAVLVFSLILLVILTFLGISALESSKLETRMVANMKDRNSTFQNAEAGLIQAYNKYGIVGGDYFKKLAELQDTLIGEWQTFEVNSDDFKSNIRIMSPQMPMGDDLFFIVESICDNTKGCASKVVIREGWKYQAIKKEGPKSTLPAPPPDCENIEDDNYTDCIAAIEDICSDYQGNDKITPEKCEAALNEEAKDDHTRKLPKGCENVSPFDASCQSELNNLIDMAKGQCDPRVEQCETTLKKLLFVVETMRDNEKVDEQADQYDNTVDTVCNNFGQYIDDTLCPSSGAPIES
ncbi:PilX N-terminal domain-containing pilus assembly protein [Candidatus Parabeggiatoa sp. HSG14]|uniref:pilus assembly PilX family protein n=1 Tax=Candidatus Parabeggiatoa sp. HSG14 TaxID=3055593 RepID=UPI0025A88C16|nr:PilX N-terminal domain-containing pilus assembly protein [Thiotrichales bacterium HSG14]